MRRYYSDDSFDNSSIDGSLTQFWEKNEKVPLAPFRYWELKEKYHHVITAKLSLREIKDMALHSIPTIIVAAGVMAIRFSDIGLSEVCMGCSRIKSLGSCLKFLLILFCSLAGKFILHYIL